MKTHYFNLHKKVFKENWWITKFCEGQLSFPPNFYYHLSLNQDFIDKSPCLFLFNKCFQRSFISKMKQAPFKNLFWNTNDFIAKLMISITSGVSLWDRPKRYKGRFSLVVVQILAFAWTPNMFRKGINLSCHQISNKLPDNVLSY